MVPKEVAERAAPAAKDWRGVVPGRKNRSVKEREIGRRIPVVATAAERGRLERRGAREVESPPIQDIISSLYPAHLAQEVFAFVDQQDQP